MKKLLSLLLCLLMAFAVIACSNKAEEFEAFVPETDAPLKTTQTDAPTPELTPEPTPEPTEEPVVIPEGISEAVDGINPLEPAEFGQWIKATMFNTVSEQNELIYWRITGITNDCEKAISEYNERNTSWIIEPLEEEGLKYYVVSYEVYFPKGFSERESGISSFLLDLNVRNVNGKTGFEHAGASIYGLSSGIQFDIDRTKKVVHAGDIYQGKLLYRMYDDIKDYLFCVFYQVLNKDEYTYAFCDNKSPDFESMFELPEGTEPEETKLESATTENGLIGN